MTSAGPATPRPAWLAPLLVVLTLGLPLVVLPALLELLGWHSADQPETPPLAPTSQDHAN